MIQVAIHYPPPTKKIKIKYLCVPQEALGLLTTRGGVDTAGGSDLLATIFDIVPVCVVVDPTALQL